MDSNLKTEKKFGYAFVAVLVAGVALRLGAVLIYPLWIDEALTLYRAREELGRLFGMQFPVSYLGFHLTGLVTGVGKIETRMVALFFELLGVAGVYWLGLRMFDRKVAAVAAGAALLSPHMIKMAHFARYPSMIFLFSVIAVGFFWSFYRTGRLRDLVAHLVMFLLAFFTHAYGAVLYAAFLAWIVFFNWRNRGVRNRWLAAQAVMAAPMPFIAWRMNLFTVTGATSTNAPFGFIPPADILEHLKQAPFMGVVRAYGELLLGPHLTAGPAVGLLGLGALVVLGVIAISLFRHRNDPAVRFCAMAVLVIPLLSFALMLVWGLWFTSQYLGYCAVFVFLLLGVVITRSSPALRIALVSALALAMVPALALYMLYPQRSLSSEDVASIIGEQWRDGDVVVIIPSVEKPLFDELLDHGKARIILADELDLLWGRHRENRIETESDALEFYGRIKAHPRAWIVFSRGRINREDRSGLVYDLLSESMEIVQSWRYEGVWHKGPGSELWLARPLPEGDRSGESDTAVIKPDQGR